MTTPRAGSRDSMSWDVTPSAVDALKKQLKSQQRKPAPSEAAASADGSKTANATGKTAAVSLSAEQRHVQNLVCNNNASVFFTGPAGTGKSVLMRSIIAELKRKWAKDPERLAVTASTGLAACNIGGMTLHSFSGIGLGKEDTQALVKKIRRNLKAKNRWLRTKALIIDEISMVDGELFDKLSQIGRIIRNNGRPWGGIQLIITGDFFQLPPSQTGTRSEKSSLPSKRRLGTPRSTTPSGSPRCSARKIQVGDAIGLHPADVNADVGLAEFAQMLNEMRLGRISEQTVQSFKSLSRPIQSDDGLEVTEL